MERQAILKTTNDLARSIADDGDDESKAELMNYKEIKQQLVKTFGKERFFLFYLFFFCC